LPDCPDYGSRFPGRSAVDLVVDVATVPVAAVAADCVNALVHATDYHLADVAVRHGAVGRRAVAAIAGRVPVIAVAVADVAVAIAGRVPVIAVAAADVVAATADRVPVIAVVAVAADDAAASAVAAEPVVRYDVEPAERAVPLVALRADFVALVDAV